MMTPYQPIDPTTDPGYCGLDLRPDGGPDAETGKWDPYWKPTCEPHDKAFSELIAGAPTQTNLQTAGRLVGSAIVVAASGAADLVLSPILLLDSLVEDNGNPSEIMSKALKGAYAVVALPFIITIGGGGGILRWAYLAS